MSLLMFLAHVKDSNLQQQFIDWWMSVRIPTFAFIVGGLGMSWLLIKLRGGLNFGSHEKPPGELTKVIILI